MLFLSLLFATTGAFAKEGIKFDKARYGVSAGDSVTVNIWGCEERPANRSIAFTTTVMELAIIKK